MHASMKSMATRITAAVCGLPLLALLSPAVPGRQTPATRPQAARGSQLSRWGETCSRPAGYVPGSEPPAADLAANRKLRRQEARLPLSFEPNEGQGPSGAKFLSHGRGYELALEPAGATLTLTRRRPDAKPETSTVSMKIVGADRSARMAGEAKLPGTATYMLGQDPDDWQLGLPTYAKVRYQSVYPGTDLVYYGNQGQLEYDFVVEPGADPDKIALAFDGADNVKVDEAGDLVLKVRGGEVRQHKPVAYQEIGGKRKIVGSRYALNDGRVGFKLAAYDHSRPLVIDPTLSFSTYAGGGDYDIAQDIAVDGAGNTWVTGVTYYGGTPNVFVRKINPTGTAALFDMTLGDAGEDEGAGIAVDANNNVYVTGQYSYPWDFDPSIYLDKRLFVMKLNSAGAVQYYAAPEGSMDDKGNDIAVDPYGYAYVTGYAQGGHVRGFPMVNGFQTESSSPVYQDGIVMVLDPAGTSIVYSSYIEV